VPGASVGIVFCILLCLCLRLRLSDKHKHKQAPSRAHTIINILVIIIGAAKSHICRYIYIVYTYIYSIVCILYYIIYTYIYIYIVKMISWFGRLLPDAEQVSAAHATVGSHWHTTHIYCIVWI
jgi:hypothetical protein